MQGAILLILPGEIERAGDDIAARLLGGRTKMSTPAMSFVAMSPALTSGHYKRSLNHYKKSIRL